jgi:hypothetical protein
MKTALCILCIFLLAGCAKDENNCTPSSQSFAFQANKSIDTTSHEVSVIVGNSTVFKFQHNYEKCEGVVGARVSREIYFEVPATQSHFQYANESLLQANVLVFLRAPINPSLRISKVIQGTIQGTQVSASKWHINASLISGGETTNFDQDFTMIE